MIECKLPSLGADMDEGKLIAWKVKPGDRVKRGDLVALHERFRVEIPEGDYAKLATLDQVVDYLAARAR